MKKIILTIFIFLTPLQTQAFEEYIVSTNGKLTDIKIENNQIINIYPLVTIMNKKDTLFVKPLQEGETSFSVLKNGKHTVNFDVKVTKKETKINAEKGFEVLALDTPPSNKGFELDLPPIKSKKVRVENLPEGLRSGE